MVPILREHPRISTADLARMCCPNAPDSRVRTTHVHIRGILDRMKRYDLVKSELIPNPNGGLGIRIWTYTEESE